MSGYANINATPNVLFDPLAAQTAGAALQSRQIANQYAPQINQLALDKGAQELGGNEIDQISRAAQSVLGLPPEQRAGAYSAAVANLQRSGFAKNAPTTYPGDAALQGIANQGISVPQQYQYGLVVPPGLAAALRGNNPPLPGQPGGGGPDPVAAMPREQALDAIAQRESSNQNVPNAQGGDASGYWQIRNATWQDGAKLAGLDVSRYPRAMDAPWMVQRAVAGALFDKYGAVPWAASAPGRSTQTAATGQPGAPPPAATRGAPAPAPDAARPELGTPGGGQPTPGMTDAQWLDAASKSYPGLGGGNDTSQQPNAGAPAPSVQATRLGGTAGAGPAALPPPGSTAALPAPPATPANGLAPPAPAAPAAPQAQPQAAQAPAQPQSQQPATGVNSPQYQQWQRMQDEITRLIPYAALPAAKARIAQLQGQQQVLMQMDVKQPATRIGSNGEVIQGEVSTLTNEFKPYPFAPSPRAVEGEATWDGKQWTQTQPGQQGVPGRWSMGGGGPPQFYPTATRPAQYSYDAQEKDYREDRGQLPAIAAAGQNAQTAQIRLQTLLDLLPKISTGAGGITRTQLANLAETAGFPGISQMLIAHSADGDVAAAQEFGKLTLASAGAAERGDLGSRGSLGAIKLYQQNNPGLDLRPGANKAMLGMQLIAAQADTDYSQAALAWGKEHGANFRNGTGDYQPLTDFDLQWQQQRNPAVYAAAMGALNGQKAADWSKGLSDPEYQKALAIVSRASPSAKVLDRSGNLISMQPNAKAAAAMPTVQTPVQAQALPPGTQYQTPDGRTFTR